MKWQTAHTPAEPAPERYGHYSKHRRGGGAAAARTPASPFSVFEDRGTPTTWPSVSERTSERATRVRSLFVHLTPNLKMRLSVGYPGVDSP